jgi:hypothetical protein
MNCTSQKKERDDAHTVAYSSWEKGAFGRAYCSQKVGMLWMTVLWGER